MKSAVIKNSFIGLLITIVCFSFCSYVLLSPFKVHYEISTSDLADDSAKGSEEYPKELVAIFIADHDVICFGLNAIKEEVMYEQLKLPIFHIAPNTPPPDLG